MIREVPISVFPGLTSQLRVAKTLGSPGYVSDHFISLVPDLKGDQSITYGSGSCSGEEWTDTVTLSPDLVVVNQYITVASSSSGFSGVSGILGLGPEDLTAGTLPNMPTETIPTIVDNLYIQEKIPEEVIGVYFIPSSTSSPGELTFGGYDSTVVTSSVNYVPLTTTSPASFYWGIDQSITYGGSTILSSTVGIVDTGTTLILIASSE